jgi:cell cycle sensor histidine kinase DivJ
LRIRDIPRLVDRTLEPMVHASASGDPDEAARHRAFIAAHMISGAVSLALIPAMMALSATPALVVFALALIGIEVLAALAVSRTGRLDTGYLMSAAALTAAVAMLAAATGGLSSFALLGFVVAPVEAATSGDRRTIARAALVATMGLAGIAVASMTGLLPPPVDLGPAAPLAAAVVGLVHAAGLAFRIEAANARGEARRRRGETRWRLFADAVGDLVTAHGRDGDVLFATRASEDLLDARPRALLADGLFRRVHVADRPAYLTALSRALHEGRASVQLRLRKGDPEDAEAWVWVEMLAARSTVADAEWPLIAVTRDIAVHKAQEMELEKAREDAEIASFAKTRFLANMSHELRTPLNAIIGFSDILGQELFGKLEQERHREYCKLIKDSGEHLLQVVNDILDMSKIEAGSFDVTPEPFDLAPVIERCRQIMQPQASRAGIELVSAVEPGLPELNADRRACRQILLNLMSNAVKFTESGGRVECGARREDRRIVVWVRDTGIGIAPEDLSRIGNPFVQAETGYNRRHEGAGLGLSVVKGLVGLHGGTFAIDSVHGEGTTVTVTLPLGEPEPSLRLRAERPAGDHARSARRA